MISATGTSVPLNESNFELRIVATLVASDCCTAARSLAGSVLVRAAPESSLQKPKLAADLIACFGTALRRPALARAQPSLLVFGRVYGFAHNVVEDLFGRLGLCLFRWFSKCRCGRCRRCLWLC